MAFTEWQERQMAHDWLQAAQEGVICDVGQIPHLWRGRLDRAAKAGKIAKWRGYWYPVAGASYGMGPLKTCFGPLFLQDAENRP